MLRNMVKAVTNRNGMRKTPTVKETEKQPPLETNLNKDETQGQWLAGKLQITAVRITPRTPQ